MSLSVDKAIRQAQNHMRVGELSEAEKLYKQVLIKFPKNKKAILGFQRLKAGIVSNRTSKLDLPQDQIQELITLHSKGKYEEILLKIKPLVELFPKVLFLFSLQGAANAALAKYESAVDSYRWAIKIDPNYAEGYYNIGNAFKDIGDLGAALDSYRKALKIKPNYAEAHNNMGLTLHEHGQVEAAIDSYKQALKINPNYAESYNNMGIALKDKDDLNLALDSYKQALKIKPDYAEAFYNMGNALQNKDDMAGAIDCYQQALKIKPEYEIARVFKLYQQLIICDWAGIEEDRGLFERLGTRVQHVSPFAILSLEDVPHRHKLAAELYAKNIFKQKPIPLPSRPKTRPRRLRIGYFSADFHNHATMFLIAKLFETHDQELFEIYAYSFGPNKDDHMRQRLIKAVTVFDDVRSMGDQEIALLARQDQIDIAVDLKGYTQNCRPGIFAYRAAPIQINYLGYPGTMGTNFIEYMVADKTVIPINYQSYYCESIINLPHSYQGNDNTRVISDQPIARFEMGLPERSFVFCCFNYSYKITSDEFNIWMRLLHKVEGSVLWLLKSNNRAETNLLREANKRGISNERLIFADKLPQAQHLARQKLADLFIDTFNVNAHTTASDALWVDLPVVTKLGKGFAARVAGSLLTAIGLPELITETEQDYEALILDLATKPQRLAEIKKKLATNRLSKPLFNTELFTKHLEDGYQQAYQRYFDGLEPDTIIVCD